jgi:hypothetical protein
MAQNDDHENPFIPQPHIIHEKRTEHFANMHRIIVDGSPGKWARAYDEFAVHESGYAASPWTCKSLPAIFKVISMWATVTEPNKVEYVTDEDMGFSGGKPE